MEVVFPISKFFKIDLDSTREDLPKLESKFCWFQANKVVFHWGRLPLRLSSMEVIFPISKLFKIDLSCLLLWSSSTEVVFYWGRLPLRSSSMEVVFPFPQINKFSIDSDCLLKQGYILGYFKQGYIFPFVHACILECPALSVDMMNLLQYFWTSFFNILTTYRVTCTN